MEPIKARKKKPWLALILSAIVPGIGHIYNEFFIRGFLLLGLNFLIGFLNRDLLRQAMEKQISGNDKNIFWGYMLAGLLLTVFAMIDAKMGADRINRECRDGN